MKTRNLTCIVCPRGCDLTVTFDDVGRIEKITGNGCRRGIAYAEAECTHPTRTVTTTVRTEGGKVVPVKTNAPIPKELMLDVMHRINETVAPLTVCIGDTVIKDILGTGADVIATANAADCE